MREENKKKKQAAKRRDKRKKKKKEKEGEQPNNMAVDDPQPSENRTNVEDDDAICSEDEASRNITNDRVQSRHPDWRDKAELKNCESVSTCRTMTVGQSQDGKVNTNSTEERRDDQPQALFDAHDQQEHSSPRKSREKSNPTVENNVKNKPRSKRISSSRNHDSNLEPGSDCTVCSKYRET